MPVGTTSRYLPLLKSVVGSQPTIDELSAVFTFRLHLHSPKLAVHAELLPEDPLAALGVQCADRRMVTDLFYIFHKKINGRQGKEKKKISETLIMCKMSGDKTKGLPAVRTCSTMQRKPLELWRSSSKVSPSKGLNGLPVR